LFFYGSTYGQGPLPPWSYWIENCYQEGEISTLITRDFKMSTETDCNLIIPNDIPNSSLTGKEQIHPFNGNPFQENNNIDVFEGYCFDECFDPNLPIPIYSHNPISCGCITLNLEITLKPCNNMPSPPCEDKILEMTYPFTLCCSCDIRQNEPND
jgi:hypothetical protein